MSKFGIGTRHVPENIIDKEGNSLLRKWPEVWNNDWSRRLREVSELGRQSDSVDAKDNHQLFWLKIDLKDNIPLNVKLVSSIENILRNRLCAAGFHLIEHSHITMKRLKETTTVYQQECCLD